MRFYTVEIVADSQEAAEAIAAQNEEDMDWRVSHADLIDPAFDLYAVTIERVGSSDYIA